jgi:hypothetical protein
MTKRRNEPGDMDAPLIDATVRRTDAANLIVSLRSTPNGEGSLAAHRLSAW